MCTLLRSDVNQLHNVYKMGKLLYKSVHLQASDWKTISLNKNMVFVRLLGKDLGMRGNQSAPE